tara:strand:- start:269 stop:664 length:396 start_codon:yes stop_codon:yes gene_type:complete
MQHKNDQYQRDQLKLRSRVAELEEQEKVLRACLDEKGIDPSTQLIDRLKQELKENKQAWNILYAEANLRLETVVSLTAAGERVLSAWEGTSGDVDLDKLTSGVKMLANQLAHVKKLIEGEDPGEVKKAIGR